MGRNSKGAYTRAFGKSRKKAKDKLKRLTSRSQGEKIDTAFRNIKIYERLATQIMCSFLLACTAAAKPHGRHIKRRRIAAREMEDKKMISYTLKVDGMMCKHCAARVEEAAKSVNGVSDAKVSLETKEITVCGNDGTQDAVRTAITNAGYSVTA